MRRWRSGSLWCRVDSSRLGKIGEHGRRIYFRLLLLLLLLWYYAENENF